VPSFLLGRPSYRRAAMIDFSDGAVDVTRSITMALS
jgi:hypothetical protein